MASHQASEQMIGYLYQVRYALYLLLDNDNTNYQISIEKFDDVAFEENGSPKELIQLKHHVNKGGSLADNSVDLWRTLKVWIDMVSENDNLLYNSEFFLITTSSAPEKSAAEILSKTDKDRSIVEAYDRLKRITETSENQTNKPFYKAFNNMGEERMKNLLKHIVVIPKADNIVDSERKIRRELRYCCTVQNEDFIFQRLEGWWFGQVIQALSSDNPVYFAQKQVRGLIEDIRSEYAADNLPIDDEILLLNNILEEDLEPRQKIFLEQLRLLNLHSGHLSMALMNYYRAYQQRAKWVRDDLIYANELVKYERRLLDSWEEARNWMLEELQELDEKSKIEAGKKVYKCLMNKDIRIREKCGEPFIMKGSYHILANELKIGWHVDFRERLQHLLSTEEGE